MSFASAIFGGSNPSLNTDIGLTGQLGGNLTGQGQSYTNAAGNFYQSILSGDSSKIARSLAPEITAAKTSQQNDQKTASMFGGRSGGTAASTAAAGDKTHADITNLIGSLTNSSASSLGSLGSSMIGQGLGAISSNADMSQTRIQNWSNSILGLGTTAAAGAGEALALSKI